MQIKEIINPGEKAKYSKIANEIGNIFNSLEWLIIFGDRIKLFGIYEDDGKLVGGFCLYEEKRIGLKIYRNPPFTPYVGPFFKLEAQNPVSIMNKWKEVLTLMARAINALPHSILSISLNKNVIDAQPFIWAKFKVIPGYTYILDLKKSIEDIFKEMSVERRNDVSKAIRDGLIVRQVDDFKIVKSLILKTLSRQEVTVNKYYLDKILFEFIKKDNSFALVTFDKERPIATTFCIYDKKMAYYLLGGYDYEGKHHGAGALSMWGAIKHARSLGLKHFDFEGSMVPQIERYFRGFGGKLIPYYRINKAKLLLEIILKFFKRELF